MPAIQQVAAPTRDEMLEVHLNRLHDQLDALPGRIVRGAIGAAILVGLAWYVVQSLAVL